MAELPTGPTEATLQLRSARARSPFLEKSPISRASLGVDVHLNPGRVLRTGVARWTAIELPKVQGDVWRSVRCVFAEVAFRRTRNVVSEGEHAVAVRRLDGKKRVECSAGGLRPPTSVVLRLALYPKEAGAPNAGTHACYQKPKASGRTRAKTGSASLGDSSLDAPGGRAAFVAFMHRGFRLRDKKKKSPISRA